MNRSSDWRVPAGAQVPSTPVDEGRGLVLVGHGSRSSASGEEMQRLCLLVGDQLPAVKVDLGFLEMNDPPAGEVIDALVEEGRHRMVVLPLVLLAAGHAKSDVPAVVAEARDRHPHVDFRLGTPLGVGRDLVAILGDAVRVARGEGLPLLVIARGTSDPDANGEAHKAARLVAEWTGAPFVHTGFTGVTGPSVPEALEVFSRLGHDRIAIAFWFLCTGKLVDRARDDIAEFTARTGVTAVDAGYIGPDQRVVPLVLQRFEEAMSVDGPRAQNCDTCCYRAAWPGLEDRVGQAIGVGHSHLAAVHRHPHGGNRARAQRRPGEGS
ncbi:MAG: sirohydrochlorin chelatase [Acidimicrobiales bacterium]